MDHEFAILKQFPNYDIENVIDDFVLICFLVGNDFIPHLPNLHIHEDGLARLFKTYMDWQCSRQLEGYLNEKGALKLNRFESFIRCLDSMEREHFEDEYADLLYMDSKRAGPNSYETPGRRKLNAAAASKKKAQTGAFGGLTNRSNMDDPNHVDETGLTAFFDDDEVRPNFFALRFCSSLHIDDLNRV